MSENIYPSTNEVVYEDFEAPKHKHNFIPNETELVGVMNADGDLIKYQAQFCSICAHQEWVETDEIAKTVNSPGMTDALQAYMDNQ